jgi:hypothetical protein
MTVFKAICIEDYRVTAPIKGEEPKTDTVVLTRGQEYTVSAEHDDGTRTVFTRYWFRAPTHLFAGVRPL